MLFEVSRSVLDSTDRLRGVKVDMLRHWDSDNDTWMIVKHDSNEPICIGTREQMLAQYDALNI